MFFGMFMMELKRTLKNPYSLALILAVPLIITVTAVVLFSSLGFLHTKIGIFNLDTDPLSRFTVGIVMSMFKGGNISYVGEDYDQKLLNGELQAVVVIPKDFSKKLYAAEQTELIFIPSPVDLQLSTIIYRTFRSMFEDLNGSPFFDPKVIRYLFTSPGYPAPKLSAFEKESVLSFSSMLVPIVVFLSTACVLFSIAASSFQQDEQSRLTELFISMGVGKLSYALSKMAAYTTVGLLVSFSSLLILSLFGAISVTPMILVLLFLNALFHACVGLIVSSLSPNVQVSSMLSVGLTLVSFYFSGTVVPLSAMPSKLQAIAWNYPLFLMSYVLRKQQLFLFNSADDMKKILLYVFITFSTCLVLGSMELRRR
ncbi:hypothetical protein AS159_07630 [Thermotoga sp. Ku-13t]|uniref:ABC transporter permease n=1 Tax=Thermotoga sp. Ku-13t TaxID=1755813 RepID=UPI0013EE29E7|nr:ABC transporter permease [Thermotoga sp. Ku-13t]KAF2957526.1 hypothetical protein AS159_07630 [Thermotoga sp. Ku-13t]